MSYEVGQVVYIEWPGAFGEKIRRHVIKSVSKAGRAKIGTFTLLPNGKLLGYTTGYLGPRLCADSAQAATDYDHQLARRVMVLLAKQIEAADVDLAKAKQIKAMIEGSLATTEAQEEKT